MTRAYLQCPVDAGGITAEYSSVHKAIDIGWTTAATKYCPIWASWDGSIVEVGGSDTSVHGRYVTNYLGYLTIGGKTGHWWTRDQHVKDICVTVGQQVKQGERMATRSNSGKTSAGKSYGVHDHHALYFGALDKPGVYTHAVDPQPCTWLFTGQTCKGSKMAPLPVPVPVARDSTVHQLQVVADKLRVRSGAGTDQPILDYAMQGFYTVGQSATTNGYTWYEVANGQWMAITKGYSVDIPVDTVESLRAQIQALQGELSEQGQLLAESQKACQTAQNEATERMAVIDEVRKVVA